MPNRFVRCSEMTAGFCYTLRNHGRTIPNRLAMRFMVGGETSSYTYGELVADIDRAIASNTYGQPGELVFIAGSISHSYVATYLPRHRYRCLTKKAPNCQARATRVRDVARAPG